MCEFLELYILKISTIILLTTFVFPLVWGWKAFDLVSLVSIIEYMLDQKIIKNLLSLYEIMVCGSQKWTKHTQRRAY
jgi:hypothetical protein